MKALLPPLFLICSGTCFAQPAQPASEPKTSEPKVEVLKTSDETVKIEEVRVRGVTQSAAVKPSAGREYEVSNTSTPIRRPDERRDGVRTWRLFTF